MKVEDFVEYIKVKNNSYSTRIKIIKNPKFKGNLLDNFIKIKYLKRIFPYVDFNCQFKNKGCKIFRSITCCCENCNNKIGFLEILPEKELSYYARKFSLKTGFWRKNRGCILAHEKRSTTCLTHHCNMNDLKFWDGMDEIKKILRTWENNIQMELI